MRFFPYRFGVRFKSPYDLLLYDFWFDRSPASGATASSDKTTTNTHAAQGQGRRGLRLETSELGSKGAGVLGRGNTSAQYASNGAFASSKPASVYRSKQKLNQLCWANFRRDRCL